MVAFTEETIDFIPLTFQREQTELAPQQFDELVDRSWIQTWCTKTERTDRAVFRVQGGN